MMQKVISINLNGNAYQIDETGYAALVAYLEGAERQLADNPDRAEIVADFEQAIADKCRGFLGPHKTVVTTVEVDQIIREMGPVEAADGAPGAAGAGTADAERKPFGRTGPRRLYRIEEDAVWMGVCSGIAAYVGIDPVFVRIVALILIFWSAGLGLVGYWILASIIPEASTPEERATARGQAFNALELIDRAKQNDADFAGRRDWRRWMRYERRAWRRGWRSAPPSVSGAYDRSVLRSLRAVLLTVVFALLAWFWVWTLFSLLARGQVFGRTWPDNLPPWLGIVALVVLFQVVAWPLRFARRQAYYAPGAAHYDYGPLAALGSVMSLAFWIFAAWLAYHYVPEVREFIRTLPDVLQSLGDSLSL